MDSSFSEPKTHRDGIAPDEVPIIPLTEEPEKINQGDEYYGQNISHNEIESNTALQPPQSRGPVTVLREPTMPPMDARPATSPQPPNTDNLFLGGGEGAGYGPFAYGIPLSDSRAGSEYGQEPAPASMAESRIGSATPLALFDDDHGHQFTLRPSTSQPMSLFSNYPRSGQNSAMPFPAGSRQSSRPGSVLMTIFDEPVWNLPGSRSVSRSGSIHGSGSGAGVVAGGNGVSRVESNPMSRSGNIPYGGGQGGSGGGDTGTVSPVSTRSPESNIGPFDEMRSPGEIPHFENDVDLNHVGAGPQ